MKYSKIEMGRYLGNFGNSEFYLSKDQKLVLEFDPSKGIVDTTGKILKIETFEEGSEVLTNYIVQDKIGLRFDVTSNTGKGKCNISLNELPSNYSKEPQMNDIDDYSLNIGDMPAFTGRKSGSDH